MSFRANPRISIFLCLFYTKASILGGVQMFEVEYSEYRAGELQTLVRRFDTKAEADDFFAGMRYAGTSADNIKKNY